MIHRDGLEQCTVRNVAKEAGLSAGSMRHYFPISLSFSFIQ
ncbi:TetR family transcriptional regulator [Bacillus licheniformis]|nr:TetR family transcriptional regulator [Bacillus licheniformis]